MMSGPIMSRTRRARIRRRRILRQLIRAIAAGAILALAAARLAMAQTAGTTDLLSAPGAWPTTGSPDATTALALDPSALFLNPAGLAIQDERSLLVHHGLLNFDTDWDLAAVGYPIPGLGAVGLGLARVGTSGIESFDGGNQPLGTIGYTETSLAAGVARRVAGPVTAGATFKVLSQSLGDASAAAPALDLGVVLKHPLLRGGQIGLSAQNVAAGSLDLGGRGETLQRSFRIGLAAPEWRFARVASARGALDLASQGGDGMKLRASIEVARAGIGSVRAGLNGGRAVGGVGIQWRRYGLDVAVAQGEFEMTQQIALHVAWGEPVSRYEERRRAEIAKAAEDSLRARHAVQIGGDRARAEEMEARGDWDGAIVLWEVLQRELPNDATFADRAARARAEVAARARRDVETEGSKRLQSAFFSLTRDALLRGDLEEAEGLWRALGRPAAGGGQAPAESLAALDQELRSARGRTARRAAALADSLRQEGRVLEAADQAALALRLRPEDEQARAVWTSLEERVGKSASEAATLSRKLEALTAVHAAAQAFNEGRYTDAQTAIRRALALDPNGAEAREWRDRIQRRLTTPKPELDARVKQLYIRGMEAFTAGDYKEALRQWEQILVLDPLNESARRNILEARERLKSEASR